MGSFRDRYLKGKKTKARKASSAGATNRGAMRSTPRRKTASEKAVEADRQEQLMQLARAGQRDVGMADRDVFPETELGSRPLDELGESLIQTMTEPAYGTERAQREANYGLEPEAFPQSLTDTGVKQLRGYERDVARSKLDRLLQSVEAVRPSYERSLKDYEESKSAAERLRSGIGGADTNTAVLASKLEERKAAFDEASKIYVDAQSRYESLQTGLLEGRTTAEAIQNIQQKRADLNARLQDLEGARSAIETASESRPVEKTYYMDAPADMYAYELRAKVKANRLAQSNIVKERNRLDAMLAEIPEAEAYTEQEALNQKDIEAKRQEPLERLERPEDDVPPVVDSGDTGQPNLATNPVDEILIQSMQSERRSPRWQ